MSGPDQTEDAETIVNQDRKSQQQSHTRIRISNLLCPAEASRTIQTDAPWDSPKIEPAHTEQPRNPVCHAGDISDTHSLSTTNSPTPSSRVLATGGPSSHYDSQKYSNSPVARATNYEYANHSPRTSYGPKETRHPMDHNQRRDSGLGRREIDLLASRYSPRSSSHSTFRRDPTSYSTSVDRSPSLSTSPAIPIPSKFFSRPPLSGQRSNSFCVDHFRANYHVYDVEQPKRRHDRAKSDFALHQQNYGPYLAKSPTPEPAFPIAASRYPASHPVHDNHGPSTPPPPQPQASFNKPNAYFHDLSYQSDDQSRSPYHHMQDSRRSLQADSRRASQGIILPSPESLFGSAETRMPARIYGLDAADVLVRPPLSSSAAFGAKPLQDIPDEPEGEFVRRPTNTHSRVQHSPSIGSYAHSNDTSSRHHDTTMTHQRYDFQDDRRASTTAATAPYQQSHSNTRPYSPNMDIQPPSWYQQYAHAVSYKPQARDSFPHQNVAANGPSIRRGSEYGLEYGPSWSPNPQQNDSPEPRSARSSFSTGSPVTEYDTRRIGASVSGNGYSHGHSRPQFKSRLSTGHSVHPFDMPAETFASPSPKAGKNDRGNEADQSVPEEGVKAKRKRANAEQLSLLNAAFERSYFPSTEERLRLSKQTKMCPRTVQIWFQNKRQSVKARTEAMDIAVAAASGRRRGSHALEQRGRMGTTEQNTRPSKLHEEAPAIHQGEKRRNSGPLAPSDAAMAALHIQRDGRDVDYFSRKRRATIAKMELSEH